MLILMKMLMLMTMMMVMMMMMMIGSPIMNRWLKLHRKCYLLCGNPMCREPCVFVATRPSANGDTNSFNFKMEMQHDSCIFITDIQITSNITAIMPPRE